MKFFQSSSSENQLCDATGSCLPRVLRRLPCFHGLATHRRIKESTELCCATANPGVVAKLMGLDSVPQRVHSHPVRHQEDRRNLITRSQPISQTPMVLEMENGKFVVLGFEAGRRGKGDSRSNSRRKQREEDESCKTNDGSKKKKPSNGVLEEVADVDFELGIFDQLVLELVYIF